MPTFSLGMRFQFVLKSATIALLFGSALPILYFVSAATLLLTYTIDKYLVLSRAFRSKRHLLPQFTSSTTQNQPCPLGLTLLPVFQVLRVYERPTSYNDRVATLASSVILPVCLLAHCFSGMSVPPATRHSLVQPRSSLSTM